MIPGCYDIRSVATKLVVVGIDHFDNVAMMMMAVEVVHKDPSAVDMVDPVQVPIGHVELVETKVQFED